jgi:cellobiose-specific phosphotransferase system component IIC
MAVLIMKMMKSRKRRRKEFSRASLSLSLFDVTEEFVSAVLLSFFAFVF